jgi:hypothetical protein
MQSTYQRAQRRRAPDLYGSRRQWDGVVEWRRAQTAEVSRGGEMSSGGERRVGMGTFVPADVVGGLLGRFPA